VKVINVLGVCLDSMILCSSSPRRQIGAEIDRFYGVQSNNMGQYNISGYNVLAFRILIDALDTLSDFLFDNIHNTRFGNGAKISKLITLTVNDLAHNATHDLFIMIWSAMVIFWRRRHHTFPDLVLGKSLTMMIFLGAAKGPITLRTWRISSLVRPASLLESYVNSL
jgi:hypothetical protein